MTATEAAPAPTQPEQAPEEDPSAAETSEETYDEPQAPGSGHVNVRMSSDDRELGRFFRGDDPPSPAKIGGDSNFAAYGDLRINVAQQDNGVPGFNPQTFQLSDSEETVAGLRLNLDLDFKIGEDWRFHAFLRPFRDRDENGLEGNTYYVIDSDKRVDDSNVAFADEPISAYFEGRLGRHPFAVGMVPLRAQDGIWMDDVITGAALSFISKNGTDVTVFVGVDDVHTDAVRDETDADVAGFFGSKAVGSRLFEFGYAYLSEDVDDFTYHNVALAVSGRYRESWSNAVRVIGNFGQDPIPGRRKTADGFLVLVENSFPSDKSRTPYVNLFYGVDTPQSVARDPGSGGLLLNTAIFMETDGITGYPTLDARGHDSYGVALGVHYALAGDRQLILEATGLDRHGDIGQLLGAEYGFALRYEQPIGGCWSLRLGGLVGARDEPLEDISGARVEVRGTF